MNRTSKRVLAFFLTLVLMLSLCACAQMKQLWAGISIDGETPAGKHNKKPPEKPHPGAEGSDMQPTQTGFSQEAEQSLAWLRDRIDFPQTMFGAAYLGYVEEDSGGDWLSAADQAIISSAARDICTVSCRWMKTRRSPSIVCNGMRIPIPTRTQRSAIGRKAGNRCCSLPISMALHTRQTRRSGSLTTAGIPANGTRPSTP